MARIAFDDIEVGRRFETLGRTLTEADIVGFAGLSGDFHPLHVDASWVRDHTPFRDRIAHGLLGVAITSGLQSEYAYDWDIIAYLECQRRFRAPIYPQDSIHARYEVTDRRESASRPGAGIVTLSVELVNQDGDVVQSGEDVVLVAGSAAGRDGDTS